MTDAQASSERQAFIREASMRAMQGFLAATSEFEGRTYEDFAKMAVLAATGLWDAIQEAEKNK